MASISTETDLAICSVLTGWDRLEKRNGRPPVIDFNLPGFSDPAGDTRYDTQKAVLADLQDLQREAEVIAWPRLAQKMRAQETYLRQFLDGPSDFKSYIENTMGFTPAMIPEDKIARQRARLEEAIRPWNLALNRNFNVESAAVRTPLPEQDLGGFFHDVFDRNAAALARVIGPIPDFKFDVAFAYEDAPWAAWVDGARKDYRLRFNRHHMTRHTQSESTLWATHELLSHLVQSAITFQKIEDGQLPRCMGLTTMHGPEQFQSEGLAQSITSFLDTPDAIDPQVVAFREEMLYFYMVYYNNAFLMLNSGVPKDECADYVCNRVPYRTPEDIARRLDSLDGRHQERSYIHVYGMSGMFFQDVALRADRAQKDAFLARIYHDWLPASELAVFRDQLLPPAGQPVAASALSL